MEAFKRESLALLERQLNGRIYYDSISPSVFMFLEVRNLRISSLEKPDDFILRLQRIKIHYNLFKLLFNPDPLRALSEINISNTSLSLEWERDQKTVQLLNKLLRSPPSKGDPKLYPIKISGAKLALRVRYSGNHFDISNIFFQLERHGEQYILDLKNAKILATIALANGEIETVESSIRLKANLNESLDWIDSQLRISSLASSHIAINRQTFYVSYRKKSLEITKIKDKSPIDLSLYWNSETHDLIVSFKSQKFVPLDIFSFRGEWGNLNEWLKAEVSGNGRVSFDLDTARLAYGAQIRILLRNRYLPAEVRFASVFDGNERCLYLKPLLVDSSVGSVSFEGNVEFGTFLPQGTLNLRSLNILSNLPLNASLKIDREGGALTVRGDYLSFGSLVFRSTALELNPIGRQIAFRLTSSLEASDSSNRIHVDGNALVGGDIRLSLKCELREIPFERIYRSLSAEIGPIKNYPALLPEYFLSADFNLATDFRSFDLQLSRCELATSKYISQRTSASAAKEAHSSGLSFVEPELMSYHTLSGFANLTYSRDRTRMGFSTSFNLNGFDYRLNGTFDVDSGYSFFGSYGINGFFKRVKNGFSFGLKTLRLPVPIKDPPIWVSLNLDASKGDKTPWLIASTDSSLHNLPIFASKENIFQFAGHVYGSQFTISRIHYQDEFSSLSGNGSLELDNVNSYSGQLGLENAENNEAYTISVNMQDKEIDLDVEFLGLPVNRLYRSSINGKLDGEVRVQGSIDDPSIDAQLDLEEGKWNADPLDLSAQVRYYSGIATISSLNAVYLNNRLHTSEGLLDLNEGRFSLTSLLTVNLLGSTSTLNLSIDASIPKERLSLRSNIIWDEMRAVAWLRNITVDGEPAPAWSISLRSENNMIFIDGGPADSIHGSISSELDFNLSLLAPLPVKGVVKGVIENNTVKADFPYIEINFPLLTLLLGEEVFQFLEGTASGKLSISGMITDPDFFGQLQAKGVRVGFYMAVDSTERFDTKLLFNEKQLYFGVIETKAGNTELWSQGTLILSHWGPESYELHFWNTDPVGLHLVHDFGTVFADGYASGRVRVRGDWNNTRVDGKLQINYCKITLGEKAASKQAEVEDEALLIDMDLEAGKRVEFLWPSVNFPVLRANVNLGSRLLIAYNSSAVDMSIRGDVGLKGGEVFYFDRSFYFKKGTIRFNETIDNFDPHLNLRAEIRERDENDEEVKIYLIVENERLSEFSPRFQSEPSRSDLEIIALLGGPIQSQLADSGFGYSALLLSSDIVSQFGIVRPVEQSIRDALRLDLFSIRTRVIQNVVFDRVLGIEKTTLDLEPGYPGSYFNNTTIALGKYIGNDLFFEALVRFYGGGELGLKTDILISLEWPTPFFNLEWTVSPSLEGLEDVLLHNNTLTFSWLYSY
jgi:translocation and assembly module TamB